MVVEEEVNIDVINVSCWCVVLVCHLDTVEETTNTDDRTIAILTPP